MSGLGQRLSQMTLVQAFISGLVVAGFYFFTVYDSGKVLDQQITQLRASTQEKSTELAKLKAIDSEKEVLAVQLNSLREQFKEMTQILPTEFTLTELSRILIEEARSAGTTNIRIQQKSANRNETSNDGLFEQVSAEVSFEGHFSKGMLFLAGISKWPRIIHIDDVEISLKSSERLEPQNYIQEPILTFRVAAIGYRYIPPEPPKDSKESATDAK